FVAGAAFGSVFPTYNLDIAKSFKFTAPSVTLKYAVDTDLNFYVTYSTGFRPGAFNLTPTSAATVPYDEERAENYEAGVKA
ncbi:TonB-dependent receptor domain-containing protein, partial [Klebsiella variicola]|uniref:TonB-dependent receptor domain-containing protein n=2 Tax=Pseudomonadota TaxID=1224 RepID=UPI002730E258